MSALICDPRGSLKEIKKRSIQVNEVIIILFLTSFSFFTLASKPKFSTLLNQYNGRSYNKFEQCQIIEA
jgi:hypothetical protein